MQANPLLRDHPVTEKSVDECNPRLEWLDQAREMIILVLPAAMAASALAGAGERGQSKSWKSLKGSRTRWRCFGADDDSPPSIWGIDLMFTDLSRPEYRIVIEG